MRKVVEQYKVSRHFYVQMTDLDKFADPTFLHLPTMSTEQRAGRFDALRTEWEALAPIADFDRDVFLSWKQPYIPCPGECIQLSEQLVIDGISYEELVRHQLLKAEFREPKLVHDSTCANVSGSIPSMVSHERISQDIYAPEDQPNTKPLVEIGFQR